MNVRAKTAQVAPEIAGGQPRFEALDSWRGIAALMVVLFHSQIVSNVHDLAIVRAGEVFVDFFFVLSGFVIAHAYLNRIGTPREFGAFFAARLGRLYPLHLFMLLLFLAFEFGKAFIPGLTNPRDSAFSGANDPSSLLANLLLLHAILPGQVLSWNTPSWSISAEFLAYAFFGLAVLRFRSRLALALLATAAAAPIAITLFAQEGMLTTIEMGAVRALYGFSLGALLYVVAGSSILAARKNAELGEGRGRWTAAEIGIAAAIIAAVPAAHETRVAYAMPLLFALAVYVFAIEGGLFSRLLRLRLPLLLGALSYSIYMTHLFVQLRFTNLARLTDVGFGTHLVGAVGRSARYGQGIDPGNLFVGDLLTALMVVATVVFSYLTWRTIEMPGQAWAKRLMQRRRTGRNEKAAPEGGLSRA